MSDGHHNNCKHDHHHGHSHADHSHKGHHHELPDLTKASAETIKRFRIAFYLNLSFALIELIGGFWVQSMAILSDALHDFGDAMALGFALYLERSSRAPSTQDYTYGFRRYSVLSAVITGVILLLGSSFILVESVQRWQVPSQPEPFGMMLLALLGLSVNTYAAFKLSHSHSLNEKMLRLHLLEDVFGWLLVLVGAALIQWTGWVRIDLVLAIALSSWVIYNVIRNLQGTWKVFLQATPENLQVAKIVAVIRKNKLVKDIHHCHLWSMDGSDHVFTAHVVVSNDLSLSEIANIKSEIKKSLLAFQIVEATLEFESEAESCLDPHHQST
jgi:cobalt-zinc-cadmium efflux system protein